MDRVLWETRPSLRRPAAVVAFEGWGDAGSASSLAAMHLLDTEDASRVAVLEADDFFDYQVRRPTVEIDAQGVRRLDWPDVEIHAVHLPAASRDLVVVTGSEPNIRWRAFAREVVGVVDALGVEEVITLGAFAGQVPHTLPVPLVASASDPGLVDRYNLFPSGYEGPTGIIGVLTQALAEAGRPVMSIWAAVPHYLSSQDYPPAALALLDTVLEVLEVEAEATALRVESEEFRQQIDEALDDPELRSYIEELEADSLASEEDPDPAHQLVEEIERFLRDA